MNRRDRAEIDRLLEQWLLDHSGPWIESDVDANMLHDGRVRVTLMVDDESTHALCDLAVRLRCLFVARELLRRRAPGTTVADMERFIREHDPTVNGTAHD